jgi:hypothetical protein
MDEWQILLDWSIAMGVVVKDEVIKLIMINTVFTLFILFLVAVARSTKNDTFGRF